VDRAIRETHQEGATQVDRAIRESNEAALQYRRDANAQGFTERYGATRAQLMYNLCDVTDDLSLPETHRQIASQPRGNAHSILASDMETRAFHSPVPLAPGCYPLATTKLVEELFRSFRVASYNAAFGEGLTPFAIPCQGHAEAKAVTEMSKKAQLAEGSLSISLSDASTLTATDVRYPTTAQIATEKLYAWSIVVDLFHGVNHPVSVSIRNFVLTVGPSLHSVYNMESTPAEGMDRVIRVLYEAQQDYARWATLVSREADPARRPPVPEFARIIEAVLSLRAESLSHPPASWKSYVHQAPLEIRAQPPTGVPASRKARPTL
jgi:hypothetical protein